VSYASPAYQHYAREWLAQTAHLTLAAQGALQRLLDMEWSEGPLPTDRKKVARVLGTTPAEFAVLWEEIAPFFVEQDGTGTMVNEKIERYRREREQWQAQQSRHGKRGAQRRWHPEQVVVDDSQPSGHPIRAGMATPMATRMLNDGSASASASASAPETQRQKLVFQEKADGVRSRRNSAASCWAVLRARGGSVGDERPGAVR